jgi:hypothetical protein
MSLWRRRARGRHERGAAPRPQVAAEPVPDVPGPRVELTFRDGSSAALDAESARALADVAQVLTRRD